MDTFGGLGNIFGGGSPVTSDPSLSTDFSGSDALGGADSGGLTGGSLTDTGGGSTFDTSFGGNTQDVAYAAGDPTGSAGAYQSIVGSDIGYQGAGGAGNPAGAIGGEQSSSGTSPGMYANAQLTPAQMQQVAQQGYGTTPPPSSSQDVQPPGGNPRAFAPGDPNAPAGPTAWSATTTQTGSQDWTPQQVRRFMSQQPTTATQQDITAGKSDFAPNIGQVTSPSLNQLTASSTFADRFSAGFPDTSGPGFGGNAQPVPYTNAPFANVGEAGNTGFPTGSSVKGTGQFPPAPNASSGEFVGSPSPSGTQVAGGGAPPSPANAGGAVPTATSAPATSAPATSAPATSAPATSAPSAAPPTGGPGGMPGIGSDPLGQIVAQIISFLTGIPLTGTMNGLASQAPQFGPQGQTPTGPPVGPGETVTGPDGKQYVNQGGQMVPVGGQGDQRGATGPQGQPATGQAVDKGATFKAPDGKTYTNNGDGTFTDQDGNYYQLDNSGNLIPSGKVNAGADIQTQPGVAGPQWTTADITSALQDNTTAGFPSGALRPGATYMAALNPAVRNAVANFGLATGAQSSAGADLFGAVESNNNMSNRRFNYAGAGGPYQQKRSFQQQWLPGQPYSFDPAQQRAALNNFAAAQIASNPNISIGDLYSRYYGSRGPWRSLPSGTLNRLQSKAQQQGVNLDQPASNFFGGGGGGPTQQGDLVSRRGATPDDIARGMAIAKFKRNNITAAGTRRGGPGDRLPGSQKDDPGTQALAKQIGTSKQAQSAREHRMSIPPQYQEFRSPGEYADWSYSPSPNDAPSDEDMRFFAPHVSTEMRKRAQEEMDRPRTKASTSP